MTEACRTRLTWRRGGIAAATLSALALLAASGVNQGPALLLWNASASVPVGLYAVAPHIEPSVGDLAVSALPTAIRAFAATRRYLPAGVLLIKPVAAKAGTQVCRFGAHILVDGRAIADARPGDRLGRPLPVWGGCRVLAPPQIFLMNSQVPDSFDGRYFGPTDLSLVKGRAVPLLTFAQPSAP